MTDPGNPPPPPEDPAPDAYPPPPPPPGAYPPPPAGTYPPPPPYGAQPMGYGAGYAAPQPPGGAPVPYASWLRRVGSYLLDNLLLVPFLFLAGIGVGMASDTNVSGGTEDVGVLIAVVGYAGALAFWIWNSGFRQGRTGSSLGKQWVGTRLIKEQTGQPLGGWLSLGRQLLHVLDSLPCDIGYLWPLWDQKRQTFADKIVKSVVIYPAGSSSSPAPTYPAGSSYPSGPTYP